jgi:hypothetical protein
MVPHLSTRPIRLGMLHVSISIRSCHRPIALMTAVRRRAVLHLAVSTVSHHIRRASLPIYLAFSTVSHQTASCSFHRPSRARRALLHVSHMRYTQRTPYPYTVGERVVHSAPWYAGFDKLAACYHRLPPDARGGVLQFPSAYGSSGINTLQPRRDSCCSAQLGSRKSVPALSRYSMDFHGDATVLAVNQARAVIQTPCSPWHEPSRLQQAAVNSRSNIYTYPRGTGAVQSMRNGNAAHCHRRLWRQHTSAPLHACSVHAQQHGCYCYH